MRRKKEVMVKDKRVCYQDEGKILGEDMLVAILLTFKPEAG